MKTAEANVTRQEEKANDEIIWTANHSKFLWDRSRQHDLDVSVPLTAAVQAVGIAATALRVAMTKAESLGKAYWSQTEQATTKKTATIQREINKSAPIATHALPDLSETDATIAMIQAK